MMDDSWASFAQLQAKADSKILNDTYWATDDALNDILDLIAAGQPAPTEQQIDDLIGNRRRKHRRRRELVMQGVDMAVENKEQVNSNAAARVDIADALRPLSLREARIVLGLAAGETHDDLAKSLERPIGSIKTWAHRARHKMAA